MKIAEFILLISLTTLTLSAQTPTDTQQRDAAFYKAVSQWFSAWELVSKEIYKIDTVKPVEFVFFDEQYVYATSAITVPNGSPVKGPSLMNLQLNWKKALHNGSLTFPDGSVVPAALMSFAAEIPNSNQSFFVMPLPSYWEKAGVTSKELGLENLVTGVFIHEFSHSQQMQNFGKKMTGYEHDTDYGVEFSDDIVQNLFAKDITYLTYYHKELNLFYTAVSNNVLDENKLNEGLLTMEQRQAAYFKDRFKNLAPIDDFFLTMEGLGQYSMYVWLIHPKGANLQKETSIEGVRRKGKWWSQDEGFALFLILDQLQKPEYWAKNMFGDSTESVIELIEKLRKK
jgi:hypothetical protein